MAIEFNSSEGYSVGIELELQLLDAESLALTGSSDAIIEAADNDPVLKGFVKHELMNSTVEVMTDVCANIDEAGADLKEKLKRVIAIAEKLGVLICSAGTHPFSLSMEQEITKDPRYARLLDNLQYVARRFNIFGLHVHIGIDGGEKSIHVMNRMLYHLPHLLALSANSPFWEGVDTGLESYRTKVFETLPVAGLPFYFKHWQDYTELVDSYIATGTIHTIRELWWDVRPHPDFGTIEVRVCDIPSTLSETLSIAALVQALAKRFSEEFDQGAGLDRPHSSVIRENKWRACRYGLGADFLCDDRMKVIPCDVVFPRLIEYVSKDSEELGTTNYLDGIREIVKSGGGAARQRRIFEETGDLKEVSRQLAKLLKDEVNE